MSCPPPSVGVEGAISTRNVAGSPHAVFAPLHYEPNYAYPLLVWLHGPGDDERQLQRIMPLVSMRNYVAVAPRGNRRAEDRSQGMTWDHSPAAIESAEQNVFDAIDAARQRFHIADRRIFLCGFECGGTTALRIAWSNPRRFAGVLTLGGPMPEQSPNLVHWDAVRSLPVLLAQGRDSLAYTEQSLCSNLRLCHNAGISVTVRQYPCGDGLTQYMLHDIDLWMMEIVTGIPTGPEHPPVAPVDSN